MEKTTHNRQGRELKEADIEKYGAKRFKELGWDFEKFVSPQKRSVPDRICTAPGFVFFIEFKRPGESATPLQQEDHKRRRAKGILVFVVDSYEELEEVITIVQVYITTGVVIDIPWYVLS